jgi:hypothetical protein
MPDPAGGGLPLEAQPDSSGNPADISGHFQFTTNANGQPTAMVASVNC